MKIFDFQSNYEKQKSLVEVIEKHRTERSLVLDILFNTEHILMQGATGFGKSVIIKRILSQLKMIKFASTYGYIVHDISGDFVTQFYNPKTDYIFNPLDKRSVQVNLFSLIEEDFDIPAIANSMIPDIPGQEPIWINSARDIIKSMFLVAIKEHNEIIAQAEADAKEKTLLVMQEFTDLTKEEWRKKFNYFYKKFLDENPNSKHKLENMRLKELVTLPMNKLAKKFKDTPGCEAAYAYIADQKSSQSSNIFSSFKSHMALFEAIRPNDNRKELDLKDFIENAKGQTLFLPNYERISPFVAPLFSLVLDFLIRLGLREPNGDRRIFFFLDELANMKKINGLVKGLTLGRKHGLRFILGYQDLPRLEPIYGKEDTNSLTGGCSTKFLFMTPDSETQQKSESYVGKKLIRIFTKSHSVSHVDKDTTTFTSQEVERPAFSSAEFAKLRRHEFLFITPGTDAWVHVKGNILLDMNADLCDNYPDVESAFVPLEGFTVEKAKAKEDIDDEEFDEIYKEHFQNSNSNPITESSSEEDPFSFEELNLDEQIINQR